MKSPKLPAGTIPAGATHFYYDPARRTPVTNPWRRLDSDGTWHMLVGDKWNRIAASRRHMFVAVTDGVPAERVAHVELASESLTLRDYFAARASDDDIARILNDFHFQHEMDDSSQPTRAQARYMHADEMLSTRAQQ